MKNSVINFVRKYGLALAAVVAAGDVALGCAGPFGQPEIPECLRK